MEEINKQAQGEDYSYPATELPLIVETTDHGELDHYWLDKGIQVTGERVVRCRDCSLGMEIEPDRKVVDGSILWDTLNKTV